MSVRFSARVPLQLALLVAPALLSAQTPAAHRLAKAAAAPAADLERGLRQLEVSSAGASSDPGVQTWSHFMRFRIPCAALAEVLTSEQVQLSIGGISEHFQPDHLEALRDLLSRVGAWPDGCREPGEASNQSEPPSGPDSTNSLSRPSD
jgi:hypothetical protein